MLAVAVTCLRRVPRSAIIEQAEAEASSNARRSRMTFAGGDRSWKDLITLRTVVYPRRILNVYVGFYRD